MGDIAQDGASAGNRGTTSVEADVRAAWLEGGQLEGAGADPVAPPLHSLGESPSRGLGDVYKRQNIFSSTSGNNYKVLTTKQSPCSNW